MNKAGIFYFLFLLIPIFGCALISSYEILDSSFLPRFIFLSFFLSISIIWLLYNQWNADYHIPWKHPLIIFMLLWLLASIASIPNVLNRAEYLAEVQKVFLYFTTFLVFSTVLNKQKESLLEYFLKANVVITLFLIAIGIYQFYKYNATISVDGMERVTSLMSYKNLFSEYIALCLPFLMVTVLKLNRIWKIVAFISAVAVLMFIVIVLARSVWVALPVSFLFILILSILWYRKRKVPFNKNVIEALALSVAVIFLVTLLLSLAYPTSIDILKQRLISIAETDKGSAGGRLQLWQLILEMIKNNFITGVGAGNWKLWFQNQGWNQSGTIYNTEPLNDYLGIFVECGFFGFIGYVGILLTGIVMFLIKIFSEKNNFPVFHIAFLASLLIYCVISFFNFPKDRIEHFVFLAFLLAFSCGRYFPATPNKNIITVPILLIITAGLIYCQWCGCQRYIAERHTRLALEARNNQQWKSVIKEINKAQSPYYTLDPTTTPVIWYRGVAYYTLGETDLAFVDFQSAYKANPFHIHVLNNLATCFELKGNHEQAITLYKEAIRINPHFVDAIINLTAVLYNLKQYDQALLIIEQSPQKNYWKLVMRKKLILQAIEGIKE
jgi:O-antigen ligase/Tfp pilus assembly protein PilF